MKYYGKIIHDDECEEPYLPDEIKMFIFSRRYQFGTPHKYKPDDVPIRYRFKKYKIYPLYAYIHSGISLSLSSDQYPFNDRWDAGQIGWIVTPKKYKIEHIEDLIKEYNCWLCGDTWGFVIYNEKDEEVDTCWNFIGREYVESEMNAQINTIMMGDVNGD